MIVLGVVLCLVVLIVFGEDFAEHVQAAHVGAKDTADSRKGHRIKDALKLLLQLAPTLPLEAQKRMGEIVRILEEIGRGAAGDAEVPEDYDEAVAKMLRLNQVLGEIKSREPRWDRLEELTKGLEPDMAAKIHEFARRVKAHQEREAREAKEDPARLRCLDELARRPHRKAEILEALDTVKGRGTPR